MENYCNTCIQLDKNSQNFCGEYYCNEKCKYINPSNKACSQYVKKQENGYQPAGCFITTMICDILGKSDDCIELETLRKIRAILQKLPHDSRGFQSLQIYDQIGPKISKSIAKDGILTSSLILQKHLLPCIKAINDNEIEKAIGIYQNMIKALIKFYNLSQIEVNYDVETPIEDLGKARKRSK